MNLVHIQRRSASSWATVQYNPVQLQRDGKKSFTQCQTKIDILHGAEGQAAFAKVDFVKLKLSKLVYAD